MRRARGKTLDDVARACDPPTTPQTIGRSRPKLEPSRSEGSTALPLRWGSRLPKSDHGDGRSRRVAILGARRVCAEETALVVPRGPRRNRVTVWPAWRTTRRTMRLVRLDAAGRLRPAPSSRCADPRPAVGSVRPGCRPRTENGRQPRQAPSLLPAPAAPEASVGDPRVGCRGRLVRAVEVGRTEPAGTKLLSAFRFVRSESKRRCPTPRGQRRYAREAGPCTPRAAFNSGGAAGSNRRPYRVNEMLYN